ncbi:MAG: hypothetical protein ACREV8_01555 [Gammaproteobacteria bacterium]
MVFPLWVLLVSLHILVGNLRGSPQASAPPWDEESQGRCKKH